MHFHANPINLHDSALSTAQAAETAISVKRAKELREVAAKLKASALGDAPKTLADQESIAMMSAWAGNQNHPLPSTSAAGEDTSLTTKPAPGVSFWA